VKWSIKLLELIVLSSEDVISLPAVHRATVDPVLPWEDARRRWCTGRQKHGSMLDLSACAVALQPNYAPALIQAASAVEQFAPNSVRVFLIVAVAKISIANHVTQLQYTSTVVRSGMISLFTIPVMCKLFIIRPHKFTCISATHL
jgi:hypothetical protein